VRVKVSTQNELITSLNTHQPRGKRCPLPATKSAVQPGAREQNAYSKQKQINAESTTCPKQTCNVKAAATHARLLKPNNYQSI